jgi:hypothetical protein
MRNNDVKMIFGAIISTGNRMKSGKKKMKLIFRPISHAAYRILLIRAVAPESIKQTGTGFN